MILLADANGNMDGTVAKICHAINTNVHIIPITRINDFKFNESLYELKGPYIISDFCEYDWNYKFEETHFFGVNHAKFRDKFNSPEWDKLNDFIRDNPPALYLKREILKKDVGGIYQAIDYPCWFHVPEPISKEEFDRRPIAAFFFWGYSSEYRRDLHGEIWLNAKHGNYMVCDNIQYLQAFLAGESNPKKVVTVNIPHYSRIDMSHIIGINGASKISVSLAGAGNKCFRHFESSVNSLMFMQRSEMAWMHDWVENENCLKCDTGGEIQSLLDSMNRTDLYEIYKAGVINCKKYELSNYISDIQKLITESV
jgi:hypothetical protein